MCNVYHDRFESKWIVLMIFRPEYDYPEHLNCCKVEIIFLYKFCGKKMSYSCLGWWRICRSTLKHNSILIKVLYTNYSTIK